MLTELERSRLEKRNDPDSPAKEKRYNDMIVRKKLKQWLEDGKDALFIINELPDRQLKRLAVDEEIYNLLSVCCSLLDPLEFAKVQGNSIKDAVAVKATKVGDKWERFAHKATEKDFERNNVLFWIMARLECYTSYPEPELALNEYVLKFFDEQPKDPPQ